jgi:hypothetical protein
MSPGQASAAAKVSLVYKLGPDAATLWAPLIDGLGQLLAEAERQDLPAIFKAAITALATPEAT